MPEKAVIYTRVSSQEQAKSGFSIPAQEKFLQEYAKKHNYQIVKNFSENISAKDAGRAEFQSMISFVEKNKSIKHILVEKNDRLMRNEIDFAIIINLAKTTNVNIHLVKDSMILNKQSNPLEIFMFTINTGISAMMPRNLSNEVKKGLREKAEQGYWPTQPPYGYTRVYGDNKNLVIKEEEAKFVKKAFELYAIGTMSLEAVRKELYEQGYFYKPYKPKIGTSHLDNLLKNPLYKGMFVYGGILYKGKHEPIVSNELFEEVQLAYRKANKPKYNSKEFLFNGLIKCGECGCSVCGDIKKQKYIYYKCSLGKKEVKCSQNKYTKQEQLEAQIYEAIKAIKVSPKHREWIVKAIRISNEKNKQFSKERISHFQIEKNKCKNYLEKMYFDKLDGKITEEFWNEQHNKISIKIERYNTYIEAFDRAELKTMQQMNSVLELAQMAPELYLGETDEYKRKIINSVLSNLTLKDGKLSYDYKKPFDVLVKGLCFKKDWAGVDSNHRTLAGTDLQSVAFSHSATYPYLVFNLFEFKFALDEI